jgi:AmiR/NasT family two-component response regulator
MSGTALAHRARALQPDMAVLAIRDDREDPIIHVERVNAGAAPLGRPYWSRTSA